MGSYIPTQSLSLIVSTVVWCMCVKDNMLSWFFPSSSHAISLVHFVALHARLKAVSALVWRRRTWIIYQIIGKMQLVSEFFMKRIVSVVKAHFFSATWFERQVNNASAHLDSSLSASPALRFGGLTTRGIENWAKNASFVNCWYIRIKPWQDFSLCTWHYELWCSTSKLWRVHV